MFAAWYLFLTRRSWKMLKITQRKASFNLRSNTPLKICYYRFPIMMMAFPEDVPTSPPGVPISSHSSHGGAGFSSAGGRVARSIRPLLNPLAPPVAKPLTQPATKTRATQSPSATSASAQSTATSGYSVVRKSGLFGTFSEGRGIIT